MTKAPVLLALAAVAAMAASASPASAQKDAPAHVRPPSIPDTLPAQSPGGAPGGSPGGAADTLPPRIADTQPAQGPSDALATSPPPPPQGPGDDTAVLSCTGPIGPDADEASLIATFGADAVVREDVYVAEGYSEPGSVVFPDDPARRIEILWADPKERASPASVILRDGSAWRFDIGAGFSLGNGASLAEVEAANDGPLTLQGFGWDYGGYVAEWNGGRLATPPGGCLFQPRFDADYSADPAALEAVSGDRLVSSDDPNMRAVRPTVWTWSYAFPQQ